MMVFALRHWKLLLGGLAVMVLLVTIGIMEVKIRSRDATIERKDAALLKARDALRDARVDLEECSGAIGRQNAAVSDAGAKRLASEQRAADALRDAVRANSRADEAIGRIRGRVVRNCETGREIMTSGL